jgi:hypothetical protein
MPLAEFVFFALAIDLRTSVQKVRYCLPAHPSRRASAPGSCRSARKGVRQNGASHRCEQVLHSSFAVTSVMREFTYIHVRLEE